MNLYKGKIVIDVSSLVESNNEEIMTEEAHESLSSELFAEIMLVLGANGYRVTSIGATLKDTGVAKDKDIEIVRSSNEESQKNINRVYNKANRKTYKIALY
ncbi:hypothetical protein [Virgibacillus oceani]|uniref:Uncharacterized protein n=1 Tax=Virgibacillus oceani TaxID=1479511 RepID=A0A917GYD0_9BACI|nr:hypothetical protein [Virgibacillus oceani]GGG61239.1 hypothetical protein GCM10011398_00660 [Virgibacillus oceani]